MCAAAFPSFTAGQIVSDALSLSPYASGFSAACNEFSEALTNVEDDTYYLVLGLPIGPITWGDKSMCLALRPNCGDNQGEHC